MTPALVMLASIGTAVALVGWLRMLFISSPASAFARSARWGLAPLVGGTVGLVLDPQSIWLRVALEASTLLGLLAVGLAGIDAVRWSTGRAGTGSNDGSASDDGEGCVGGDVSA